MLLITLVMLIVGYVFWTYWEQPTAAQIATANAEIDSLQVIIDKAKQDLASGTVEDLRRKVEQYQALLGVMRRLVPEKNEVPALIDDISTKSKVRGVTIGRFEPLAVDATAPFDTYRYRLEILGHYDQLGEFLSDIASLPRIVVPQDVVLRAAQQQAQRILNDTLGSRSLPVAPQVGRHPAAPVRLEAGRDLLRLAVSGAQRRRAPRRHQQQDLPGEAGGDHRAPQGHDDPPARNRVYGAGIRLRAPGNTVARQAGGIAMKPMAALAAWLLAAAGAPSQGPGVSPRIGGAPGRGGDVTVVCVPSVACR